MNPDVVNSSDGTPPPRAAKRVTKAVIPAAGLGTRFLPATKAQPKEMLPVVDRPAIQYVVEEAVAAAQLAGRTIATAAETRARFGLEPVA